MVDVSVLQTTIEVPHEGETYVFKIPTILDKIKTGMLARDIRREASLNGDGDVVDIDRQTFYYVQACASFGGLLKQGPKWCWSTGAGGLPVCDPSKWDADYTEVAVEVWLKFEAALTRFRASRTTGGAPAAPETVPGGVQTEPVPV